MPTARSTSRLPTSSRRAAGFALLLLTAACDDGCPHPRSLALDFRPGADAASWIVVDPRAAPEAAPLSGEVTSLVPAAEGALIAAGWLSSPAGPKLWAADLDADFCVRRAWVAELGPAGPQPSVLQALPDGGLLAAGRAPGPGQGNDEAWVARFDRLGKPVWSVAEGEFLYVSGLFQTPSREAVTALALLPDGGIAVAGAADVNDALHSNWIMLLDGEGHVRRRVDLPRDDPRTAAALTAVVPQPGGGLWLAGTLRPGEPEADAWVLALAPDDSLLWDRRYEEPGRQEVAAALGRGEAVALAGRENGEAWLALLDAEGEMLLSQRLRRREAPGELTLLADDGEHLLAAGGSAGPWLLRLDRLGRPEGTRSLPGSGRLSSAVSLPDGRLVAGGRLEGVGPPLLLLLAAD